MSTGEQLAALRREIEGMRLDLAHGLQDVRRDAARLAEIGHLIDAVVTSGDRHVDLAALARASIAVREARVQHIEWLEQRLRRAEVETDPDRQAARQRERDAFRALRAKFG